MPPIVNTLGGVEREWPLDSSFAGGAVQFGAWE